jgi:hypothetical protein
MIIDLYCVVVAVGGEAGEGKDDISKKYRRAE